MISANVEDEVGEEEEGSSTRKNSSPDKKHPENSLGERAFLIIYALHTIQTSLIVPILPTIEIKLKSPVVRDRKRAYRLLARLFSESVMLCLHCLH